MLASPGADAALWNGVPSLHLLRLRQGEVTCSQGSCRLHPGGAHRKEFASFMATEVRLRPGTVGTERAGATQGIGLLAQPKGLGAAPGVLSSQQRFAQCVPATGPL